MSEVETEIEISPEDARQDAIRDMMDKWANGDLSDAQNTFNSIMNVRADNLVADRKAEIAASIYNSAVDAEVEDEQEVQDDTPQEMDGELPETESEEPEEAEQEDEEI